MMKITLLLCMFAVSVLGSYEEEEHEHHEPQPYQFGYEVKDKHGLQYRKEESDGHGKVHGSYGYTDEKGIYREVYYVADKDGFRAEIKTNEPGTSKADSADVKVDANPKHIEEEYHGYESGHDYEANDYRRSDNNKFLHRQGEHGGHE